MNMTSLISVGAEKDSKVSLVGFLEEKMVRCLELWNCVASVQKIKGMNQPKIKSRLNSLLCIACKQAVQEIVLGMSHS